VLLIKHIAFTLFLFSCSEQDKISPTTEDEPLDPGQNITYKDYSLDSLTGEVLETQIEIEDFSSASTCEECHPQHYSEWSSSFHARSFSGPIFMEMWSGEKNHHPQTGTMFCVQCHAPAAFVTGYPLDGIESVSDLENSDIPEIIKEGVSCDICHSMVDKSPSIFTQDHPVAVAQYYLNPDKSVKYGSMQNSECNTDPILGHTDCVFLPIFNSSSSCKPCHDQFIREMPIETTFSEWNNHPGLSMGGDSCQDCHMPKNGNHSSHYFPGVDVLFYNEITDSTHYHQVVDLLKTAVVVSFEYYDGLENVPYIDDGTMYLPIKIKNETGHNLPSGTTFFREAWLEVLVQTVSGDTVYQKGVLHSDSQLLDYDDHDLMLYTSTLYSEEELQGEIIYEASRARSFDDRTLRTLFYDTKVYEIDISDFNEDFVISARMLFRPFKPQMLEHFHASLVSAIPIIEMYSSSIILEN